MYLSVEGASVPILVPFVAAFLVTMIMSTAGLSGAFILMPFQVSVLGFVGPAVTPTNHLFNMVAIPAGVYRFVRERRMLWPLTLIIVVGTVPGVVLGSLARVYLLPDPRHFKLFIAGVLLFLGYRMAMTVLGRGPAVVRPAVASPTLVAGASAAVVPAGRGLDLRVLRFDRRQLEYEYRGRVDRVPTLPLCGLTALVGVIGGVYGVGGGAIISPLLISTFGLPVHAIAGAVLLGTFLTSAVGVGFFSLAGPLLGQASVAPHWGLGLTLGLGGILGMYTGARLQRFLPARLIHVVLALAMTGLGVAYVVRFFAG